MRLASFEHQDRERVGFAVDGGTLVALDDAWQAAGLGPARETLLALVEGGAAAGTALARAWRHVQANPDAVPPIPTDGVRWRPPVRRPSKIVGVALNNSAFAPIAHRYFEKPAFFLKPPSCLVGHGEPIEVGADYGLTHPEA